MINSVRPRHAVTGSSPFGGKHHREPSVKNLLLRADLRRERLIEITKSLKIVSCPRTHPKMAARRGGQQLTDPKSLGQRVSARVGVRQSDRFELFLTLPRGVCHAISNRVGLAKTIKMWADGRVRSTPFKKKSLL